MEHVETFVYNLASGRTLEDLKAAVERTQGEFLSGCNGFLERRLIQLKPDQFLEMNRWASEADFQKAMSEAQQHEADDCTGAHGCDAGPSSPRHQLKEHLL